MAQVLLQNTHPVVNIKHPAVIDYDCFLTCTFNFKRLCSPDLFLVSSQLSTVLNSASKLIMSVIEASGKKHPFQETITQLKTNSHNFHWILFQVDGAVIRNRKKNKFIERIITKATVIINCFYFVQEFGAKTGIQ